MLPCPQFSFLKQDLGIPTIPSEHRRKKKKRRERKQRQVSPSISGSFLVPSSAQPRLPEASEIPDVNETGPARLPHTAVVITIKERLILHSQLQD